MAKQMITCESCGRRYDYLESESCPYCGAFNYDKEIGSHLCTTEDVERIVEMRTPEHFDDETDPQPEGLDKGLMRKYARARKRLDRLETTEDVFRSALKGSRDSVRWERPEKKKKKSRREFSGLSYFSFAFSRVKINSVPTSGVLITLIFCPWAWMISFTMDSPRPVPLRSFPREASVL